MGLITGLLTLPLAPVRGVAWIAERIEERAEAELYDEAALQEAMVELQQAREAGELDPEEVEEAENELLERLMAIRGFAEGGRDGTA